MTTRSLPNWREKTVASLRRRRAVRRAVGSRLMTAARSRIQWARSRWPELSAFCLPVVAFLVALCAPAMKADLLASASITNVAIVQSTVMGLSLIALVFAVEVALRQEDRDDTVYEIMLKAVWIRPTFVLAISALLVTVLAMALSDFGLARSTAANRTICAYVLTGVVGLTLLASVLRTVSALRPTGVIDYRVRANEDERRRRIEQFIAARRGEGSDDTEALR